MAASNQGEVHIPLEIVEKILIHLPVKSLVRFKCVSKPWQSLITQPIFERKHLSHASQPENVSLKTCILAIKRDLIPLQLQPGENLRCPFLPFIPKRRTKIWPVQVTCDGLLVLMHDYSVYIWNPCLNNAYRRVLSPTGAINFGGGYCRAVLDLGYDPTVDDYKLFVIMPGYETHVYSMRSESWTRLEDFPYDDFYFFKPKKSVFVNGSFHWIGFRAEEDNPYIPTTHTLLSCDLLAGGKYGEMPLPEYGDHNDEHVNVKPCVLKGMLGVMVGWGWEYGTPRHLVVWVMKDYYHRRGEWTKTLELTYANDDDFRDVHVEYDEEGLFSQAWCIWRAERSNRFVHVESLISPAVSLVDKAAAGEGLTDDEFFLVTQDFFVHDSSCLLF